VGGRNFCKEGLGKVFGGKFGREGSWGVCALEGLTKESGGFMS
jgi:hypothetical protein